VIDAAAAASVAALHGDANPVQPEDVSTVLALLDERGDNFVTQRTRLVNQLHALLRDLLPGGADTDPTATAASRVLTGVRPAGPGEAARKHLARDLVAEIRDADQRIKTVTKQITTTVEATGSRLGDVNGVGSVIAGRLLGRTRRASRFPTAAAFASYAGVAPVEVASAARARNRLPRGGDRQLNPRTAHRGNHPDPHARQRRTRLLRREDRRGQDPQRSNALPQTPPRRPRLAAHDPGRTKVNDGPGRTPEGDYKLQRGWLNPDYQLFGEVTGGRLYLGGPGKANARRTAFREIRSAARSP
jgi:transposase